MDRQFNRVRSTKDIVISAALIIAGGVLAALPVSTPVSICGFFLIFAGLILLFVLRTGYKDSETGVSYCKTEYYFAQSLREEITRHLNSKPQEIDLTEENKGNGLRLDIYYSKTSGKAYLQLFEYIPYKYEPCSRLYEYTITDIEKLIK